MIPSFDNDPRLQALIRADQVRDYVVMVLLGLKEKHQKQMYIKIVIVV